MRQIIREEEPIPPFTMITRMRPEDAAALARTRNVRFAALVQSVRGDLDWIVLKCLEKDRSRRYATASALAEDIQRHLDGEPVLARPPSKMYRFGKYARRHRTAFAAAAVVAGALVTATIVSVDQAVRARQAKPLRSSLNNRRQKRGSNRIGNELCPSSTSMWQTSTSHIVRFRMAMWAGPPNS